jgi:2-aminoethylphosphonate-pyruvate transaminase
MTSTTLSSIRCAVILAAGEGIRLGPLGKEIPKGMLRLGTRTIIEESIIRLGRAGIERVLVVTGHLSEQFRVLTEVFPRTVALAHNEEYRSGGSLSTLVASFDHIEGDFLVLESDIVYEQRALDAVVGSTDGSMVLVSGETHAGDEVWVSVHG